MANQAYWKNVVNKLIEKSESARAAHILSSNSELLDEIVSMVGKDILIKNCLLCYSIALSAQPDLDEVLSRFSIRELVEVYKKLHKKPIETAGALMWLLEDIDPEFKWACE
jgi:hypothetical protein